MAVGTDRSKLSLLNEVWWAGVSDPPSDLEDQLERQLELPRIASRGDLVVYAAREGSGSRIVPVGVIEHVECLGTKLNVHALGDVSVFVEGGVPAKVAESHDRSARFIAGPNFSRVDRGERGRIEPRGQRMRSVDVWIANDVRAAAFKCIRIAQTETRGISRQRRRQMTSRVRVQDTGDFPTSEDVPGKTVLMDEKRERVHIARRKDMASIVV